MDELLAKVKVALRIVTDAFDGELTDLINAALLDMHVAGVTDAEMTDALIIRAVITYCKMNFGEPDQYDQLKRSYDEQKAQLGMADGYTTWS